MARRTTAARSPRLALACTALLAALVGLALASRDASAQDFCETDGGTPLTQPGLFVDSFPGPNGDNVPIDGFVRLRYSIRVPPRPFVAVTEEATGTVIDGDARVLANEVHWQARAPLSANTLYRVHISDLAGTDNAFTFRTGFAPSTGTPPVFDGLLEAPRASRIGDRDLCGDVDAVEVTVRFRRARDNGWPTTDVEYVIYETRGPGISGPVERARERGRRTGSALSDEQERSFRLSSMNASGPVCFNVQALDAYGRADGNQREMCVNPAVGNFFAGCSANRREPARGPVTLRSLAALAGTLAACATAAVSARRRARRRARASTRA